MIFIVGPTAVGKTRLAVKLAKRVGGEVISCDSMQAYKGMRVLSQAPTVSERRSIRHHLVSIIDPSREYNAAIFVKLARRAIDSIIRRGCIPIIAGGTGLYAKALIDGLFPSPEADMIFRRKMQLFASRYGSERLWERLSKIDPSAASTIHPNDVRRMIRALEIYHSTGRTMTELKSATRGLRDIYDIRIYSITMPRDDIYARIDERVEKMFEDGLLREVGKLKKARLSKTARAAIGYEEVSGYLNGSHDLATAKSTMKMNTRHFAKRQLTWFRADPRIRWFDMSRMSEREVVARMAKRIMAGRG